MKILFLSRWFPYPANNGSKLRVFHLMRSLAARHEVTLLSFKGPDEAVDVDAPALRAICQDVHVVSWKPFNPNSLKARLGVLSPQPRSVLDSYSPDMEARLKALLAAEQFDVIVASQIGAAGYGRFFNGTPALFEEVELGIFQEQVARAESFRSRLRYQLTWAKQKYYLRDVLRYFQACTVVSEQEKRLVETAVPGYQNVDVIPNCMNLADYKDVWATKRPNSLIFTGSFTYHVNHEAMVWYLRKVNPLVQAQIPDVHLSITGDHADLSLPPANNVTLTGFVDDIKHWIASSCISLAPIFMGGGTRLKILEAMALRTPVVATAKGAEGLDVEHGRHLLIADTPREFATAVVRLLREPELHQKLTENGYQLIAEKYDWPSITPRFLDLIERVARAQV